MCQKRYIYNKSRHLQCSVILEGVQRSFLRYLSRCGVCFVIKCWYDFLLGAQMVEVLVQFIVIRLIGN